MLLFLFSVLQCEILKTKNANNKNTIFLQCKVDLDQQKKFSLVLMYALVELIGKPSMHEP